MATAHSCNTNYVITCARAGFPYLKEQYHNSRKMGQVTTESKNIHPIKWFSIKQHRFNTACSWMRKRNYRIRISYIENKVNERTFSYINKSQYTK